MEIKHGKNIISEKLIVNFGVEIAKYLLLETWSLMVTPPLVLEISLE